MYIELFMGRMEREKGSFDQFDEHWLAIISIIFDFIECKMNVRLGKNFDIFN